MTAAIVRYPCVLLHILLPACCAMKHFIVSLNGAYWLLPVASDHAATR